MTTLTINIDGNLKERAQKKVRKEGETLTALIAHFLKTYLEDKWVFRLTPKEELLKAMRESEEKIRSGKAKLYNSAEEMMRDILDE